MLIANSPFEEGNFFFCKQLFPANQSKRFSTVKGNFIPRLIKKYNNMFTKKKQTNQGLMADYLFEAGQMILDRD